MPKAPPVLAYVTQGRTEHMTTIMDPEVLSILAKKKNGKSKTEYLSTLDPESTILIKWHSTGGKEPVVVSSIKLVDGGHEEAGDEENDDVWYPKLNIPNDMLTQIYHSSSEDDTNTSDVIFDVDGREFHGHKSVISVRTRTISELMKDNNTNNDGVFVVPIPNMDADIFEGVLKFIYCVEKPTIEEKEIAIKYLLAANRLGVVDMKMFVESLIVEQFLDTSNAAEMLVLADSHSCPLLKEATMKLYENDASTVMKSDGWSKIVESNRLLEELLRFVCHCKEKQKHASIDDVTNLDVTSLRERLVEAKLDIDGNQEILIGRWKDHILSRAAAAAANPPPP